MTMWPAEYEDTINYRTREFVSQSDITVRMIDRSILNIWGKFLLNGYQLSVPDRLNVRDAGINGDGTDEATKLQGLLNLGVPLLVPAGLTISVGTQIVIPSNTVLQIDGRIEKIWNRVGGGITGAMFKIGNSAADITYASNVTIEGSGSVGAKSQTIGSGFIFWIACHDLHIKDISVDNYWDGLAFLIYGNRVRMNHVNVLNSQPEAGTGGIRFCGGEDFIAVGCHIESGDDALQFVPPEAAPYTNIRRSAYIGCTGYSTKGRFLAVGTGGAGTSTVEDCSFIGCHGMAGIRAVTIQAVETVAGFIRRISIRDCSIWMNDVALATSTTGAVTIVNLSPNTQVYDITLDNVSILNPASCGLSIEKVNDVTINNCLFEKDQVPYASYILCNSGVINNFVFTNNRVEGYGTQVLMNMSTSIGSQLGTRIENNDFTSLANNSNYGIQLGAVTNAIVKGNTFRNAPGATALIAAVRIALETINARVEQNNFSLLTAGIPISVAVGAGVLALENKGIPSTIGPINTAYTVTVLDLRRTLLVNPTGIRAITFNPDTSFNIPVGEYLDIINIGTAAVTLTPGAGVNIAGLLSIAAGKSTRVFKTDVNTYFSTAVDVPVAPPFNTYTGTAVTAVLGDANGYLRFTGANPTYTIPLNSAVAFPVKTRIEGACTTGPMTIAAIGGVTVNKARTLSTVGAYSGWTAVKVATDEWDVHGDFV